MQSTRVPASTGENDNLLLAQWRSGDRAARERLLRRQTGPLRRYLSRRVPCPADVDDLLQRTMLALLDALPRFREDVALSGFVVAIANKLLLHHQRDGQRALSRWDANTCPDEVQCEQSSALAWVVREDDAQQLQRMLGRLSDENARILHLHYWEGLDATEIGRLLGLTQGAVRTRLHRARSEVKGALLRAKILREHEESR